jgi:hypothetical protein
VTSQARESNTTPSKVSCADATVIDEGTTRRGTNEIRAWRENVAAVYEYTTELVDVAAAGQGEYLARVHLAGNFPGGAVDLRFRFTVDGDAIRRLEIAP